MDRNQLDKRYQNILEETKPFLLGNPELFGRYRLEVFGKEIEKRHQFNCLAQRNQKFFELLHRLDSLTFGHQGMGMANWVFFDCAAMPAGIFGFGVDKEKLPPEFLEMLAVEPDYEGLVPVSMYMASPTSEPGKWFGHNLSSLNSFLGRRYPGLGLLTKVFACQVFGARLCYGATQWESWALEIHTQLADMRLKAAYMPSHTHPRSLCYISDYSEENILKALSGAKRVAAEYDLLLGAHDFSRQEKLHQDIERGLIVEICGRPVREEGETYFPLVFLEE